MGYRHVVHNVLLLMLACSYIVSRLFVHPVLDGVLVWVAVITFVESMTLAKGMPRNVSLILGGLGVVLMYGNGIGWLKMLEGFGGNAGLITIFVLVPQLAIPLRCERYVEALVDFYEAKISSSRMLYVYATGMTHLLGIMFNIGSVAIVYNLVRDRIDQENEKLVLNAINRGFAGCIMWSPYFAAMALVLGRYELSWGGIVRVNLPLAMVALGGGFVVDCLRLPSGGFVAEGKLSAGSRRILLSMIGFGLLLTVVMLFIEAWVGLSMILIVSMMAVVVPAAWSFFPGNRDVYVRGVRQYFQQTLPVLRGEVVLFLCAGFFAAAVAQSEVGQYINIFLRQVNLYGQFVTVLMFFGVIVLLAVIGVHPVISVSVLTGIVRPGDLGMTTEGLAVTMLSSWAIANVSSPFTAVNMMLAGLSGKSSVLTGLKWNIKYSVVMSLVLGFCITVLF